MYEKVEVDMHAQNQPRGGVWSIWPMSGLYGVAKAALGGEYLMTKSKPRLTFDYLAVAIVVAGFALAIYSLRCL